MKINQSTPAAEPKSESPAAREAAAEDETQAAREAAAESESPAIKVFERQ